MKISTKFNLIVAFFFFFVIVSVFYSYCGGLHVCYSFPFFNGQRTRVTMTSYIVETKPEMSRDEEEDLLKQTSKEKLYNSENIIKRKKKTHKNKQTNEQTNKQPTN